ncbi:MAG: hypothetical protein K2N58_10455 [Treponemataceae bacterium]|nr:hypothetical protein [Treponemataceae bacterium]
MNKSLYFMFTAASFALLVCAPGRLAYGIILIVEMNLLAVSASAFHSFMKRFDLGDLQDILTLAVIVSATILYRQIVILFSPVIALNLGFVMYMPAVSVFLLGNVFGNEPLPPLDFLMQSLKFSAFALAFFLLRDILGYGTISFPAPWGIKEAYLFNSYSTSFLAFFASIPGSLLLTIFCMAGLLCVQYKMNIIEKSGEEDGDN